MNKDSIPTRGRTLDHAAAVYDLFEPIVMLGRQAEYNRHICSLPDLEPYHRILDIGCGTGELTRLIADHLDAGHGGVSIGIDAAAKMIRVADKKRGGPACRFETAAAESLPFGEGSFDGAVSSLFFHHVDLELKQQAFAEAFRVIKPGGKLIVADMHRPTTLLGALISHMSRWFFLQPEIGENIAFPLTLNGIEGNEKTRRVLELLDRIGLPDAGKAMPQELSGGELQRVAVARAIAHHPRVILADEPTASLDSETGEKLTELICHMAKEESCTAILATHDQDIINLADETLRLRDGEIWSA